MQCIESAKTLATTATIIVNILKTKTTTNNTNLINCTADSNEESQEVLECVWRRSQLTALEFIIYAFVVPSLAFFGLCANFINAIIFMRPKMTPSAFSYLAALSWLDCISCLLITLTAFSRSFMYSSTFWMAYDFQWQTPLFGITTGAANLILACVSVDRFIYLRWGIPNGTPKFCRRVVARKIIIAVILVAILVNVPYFCVFVVNDDGTFETTEFYYSKYYMIHNWFTFILLTILPAVFLLVGNTAILIAFCKWSKQSKKCQTHSSNTNNRAAQNRYKHQMKLTITIIVVITLYLVGELPAHLTSRKSVVNLLYSGDVTRVDFKAMQRLEVICITLNAIQLSTNIIVYAVINPSFMPEFFSCIRGASDVCFRFTGIMALTSCWHKYCGKSRQRTMKKIHKNSECINDMPSPITVNEHYHRDDNAADNNNPNWQSNHEESTADVNSNKKTMEISVISISSIKIIT